MRVLLLLLTASCVSETSLDPLADGPAGPGSDAQPTAVVDVVVQPAEARVDVLFVIDDSGSMGDDQEALADAFPQLMAWFELEALDFHIGVVSTDTYTSGQGGVLRRVGESAWIDVDTPDPVDLFRTLALVGTDGASSERGLGATYLALELEAEEENAGFLRDGASLHTIVISDEDDDTPDTIIDPDAFVEWYGALKDQPDRRTFSSIVETAGDRRGSTYLAMTGALGGASADLEADWLHVLDRLGLLISRPKDAYYLSRVPVPDTLSVTLEVEGKPTLLRGEEWQFDETSNAITLVDRELLPGTRVILDYLAR